MFVRLADISKDLPQRNWPDLRRDCDTSSAAWPKSSKKTKETDLIYEGIATRWSPCPDYRISRPERNWPDLRRDCDTRIGVILVLWNMKETDLIYEGIATRQGVWIGTRQAGKETDLIYEGIATHAVCLPLRLPQLPKETDLIYEGIATVIRVFVRPEPGIQRNWPDLRRDCDVGITSIASNRSWKKLTWFTKGLRLLGLFVALQDTIKRNWPDLRRDCDAMRIAVVIIGAVRKKLTWFTKGLRRQILLIHRRCPAFGKKLTWFTKGLRPSWARVPSHPRSFERNWPDLRRDCDHPRYLSLRTPHVQKETDLIYEGIATQIS